MKSDVRNFSIEKMSFINLFCLLFANILAWSCVSIYVPCLNAVMSDFGISASMAKMTVIANVLGSIIGRIFWGPMSDNYGRKKILLRALNFALIGTLGVYINQNFVFFTIFRVIQGIGTGVMTVVTMSIISDIYTGTKRASLLGTVEMAWPIAWGIAPILGAYCGIHYGWRVPFLVLFVMLAIIKIVLSIRLGETLIEKCNDFSVKQMCFDYARLVKNKLFIIYAVIPGLVLSSYVIFALNSPLIYVKKFGLNALQFSILQSIPLFVYFITAFLYKNLVDKIGIKKAGKLGITSLVVFGVFVLIRVLDLTNFTPNMITFVICLQCLANGLLIPVGAAEALKQTPDSLLGTASSMISLGRNIIMSISFFINGLFNVSEFMLFGTILGMIIIVLILLKLAREISGAKNNAKLVTVENEPTPL